MVGQSACTQIVPYVAGINCLSIHYKPCCQYNYTHKTHRHVKTIPGVSWEKKHVGLHLLRGSRQCLKPQLFWVRSQMSTVYNLCHAFCHSSEWWHTQITNWKQIHSHLKTRDQRRKRDQRRLETRRDLRPEYHRARDQRRPEETWVGRDHKTPYHRVETRVPQRLETRWDHRTSRPETRIDHTREERPDETWGDLKRPYQRRETRGDQKPEETRDERDQSRERDQGPEETRDERDKRPGRPESWVYQRD